MRRKVLSMVLAYLVAAIFFLGFGKMPGTQATVPAGSAGQSQAAGATQ